MASIPLSSTTLCDHLDPPYTSLQLPYLFVTAPHYTYYDLTMSWRGQRARSLRREDHGSNDVGRCDHLRLQLQQTISRLRKLDKLLEVPRENLAKIPEGDQTRRLSISREKEIASNLAFLSATTDKSLKVMAVCVKEHYNGEGITIRIALNTGDLSGGYMRIYNACENLKVSYAARLIS